MGITYRRISGACFGENPLRANEPGLIDSSHDWAEIGQYSLVPMPRPDWPHHEPQTRFWLDEEAGHDSLRLTYEVGTLLFTEGFWEFCMEHVPPGWNAIQFNGPWEGGWVEPPGLESFIGVVRLWLSRYEGMAGMVRHQWRPKPRGPEKIVETTPSDMQNALGEIEALASKAMQANVPLNFET
jgi:hypothetical protein